VSKLRAELGDKAAAVPQSDTRRTISEQVRSFKAEREKLLEIEGRQPAVVAFAVTDDGKPIKPKLPPATLTTCVKPSTREQALVELERLQKSDAKAARAFYLKHKELITGGRD
jgi:hypothetical protein